MPFSNDELELAYLAGMFDGEGCISAVDNKKGWFQVRVRVSMTNKPAVQRFQERFGGNFYPDRPQTNPNAKPQSTWQVSDRAAVNFIKEVYPYIELKKPQADVVLSVYDRRDSLNRKPYQRKSEEDHTFEVASLASLRLLNQRGVKE